VTNNNGYWIGWLDLLTPSFTIALNHNQLQQLIINYRLRLAPFLNGLRVSSLLLRLTWFWFTNPSLLRMTSESLRTNDEQMNYVFPLYLRGEPNRDHYLQHFIYYPVPIRCCGNMPSEPLCSNCRLCGASLTADIRRSGVTSQYIYTWYIQKKPRVLSQNRKRMCPVWPSTIYIFIYFIYSVAIAMFCPYSVSVFKKC
jgi:hypothetical protein